LIDFFNVYIYCRKFNAEFNKLIQTVGHRARFFSKNELNTPTFANIFEVIWIFSYSHLSSQNTKHARSVNCVYILDVIAQNVYTKCAKLVDEKNN